MSQDALELVRLRNGFYRDNYRRALGALLLMLIINAGLGFVLFYLLVHKPEPKYFATSTDGRILPLYALSQPLVTRAALLQWANQAAVAVYDYGFNNYRRQLQIASNYFTPEGWKDFDLELRRTGNLQTVTSRKYVVSAVATGAPEILEQAVIQGRYTWKLQIPLQVTYENVNDTKSQTVEATILVRRVSTLEYPNGIAITSFVASERPLQ